MLILNSRLSRLMEAFARIQALEVLVLPLQLPPIPGVHQLLLNQVGRLVLAAPCQLKGHLQVCPFQDAVVLRLQEHLFRSQSQSGTTRFCLLDKTRDKKLPKLVS
ncbi:unnamed protein product [Protopolystoma xenopodis]|uniref:Uncharacterized protein n=1 Tax=Protopolystoma xenopodis TaxID=117903 RepID=A0A3S5A5U0_9PLAT|nr:unnamed protein product [Protopolystoma xenopodis]